ncbi:unnamed protein product [Cylicocyclus nassatus]|uniref:Uncharacterized protein n=1 Tax=Cylicocyclus nassatus TaxID=53992 RepID=A0AA36DUU2_CYLNA|nr:unnamed protein product [Cylicocyclus nassatus]
MDSIKAFGGCASIAYGVLYCFLIIKYNCYTHDTADYYAYLRLDGKSDIIQYYDYDYVYRTKHPLENGTAAAEEAVKYWKEPDGLCKVSLIKIEILIV